MAQICLCLNLALLGPTSIADADVRTKMDRQQGVRLKLEGKRLTATVVARPNHHRTPPLSELSGKRVRAGCGISFRHRSSAAVRDVRRWPTAATSMSFDFGRDISRRAKWCLVEATDGGDLVFVSFLRAEPRRLLAKGRGPGGEWWRLSAWRSNRLEPCLHLRTATEGSTQCFDEEAETEAKLAVALLTPNCPSDTFVLGVAARSTTTIALTRADGTEANATLYRRPPGSRAMAQYYLAVLPGIASIMAAEARDASGTPIAREPVTADTWKRPCWASTP